MKRLTGKQEGIALVSILLIIIVLLIIGVTVVGITTAQSRYSLVRNNGVLARQAAKAGIDEMNSYLAQESSWGNAKDKLPAFLNIDSDDLTVISEPPTNPLALSYSKALQNGVSGYRVEIEVNNNQTMATVSSTGYVQDSEGNPKWEKSIRAIFKRESFDVAAMGLGDDSSISIECGSFEPEKYAIDENLATLQMRDEITMRNPRQEPDVTVLVPTNSEVTVKGNPENVSLVQRELQPPIPVTPPPFPTASSELQYRPARPRETVLVKPGRAGEVLVEQLDDCKIIFDKGDHQVDNISLVGSENYQLNGYSRIIFKSGKYLIREFFAENVKIEVELDEKQAPVILFIYDSFVVNSSLFNDGGEARNIMVYAAGDDKKIITTEFNGSAGHLVLNNYYGEVSVTNDSDFDGALLGNRILVNSSSIDLDDTLRNTGTGIVQLTSWNEF